MKHPASRNRAGIVGRLVIRGSNTARGTGYADLGLIAFVKVQQSFKPDRVYEIFETPVGIEITDVGPSAMAGDPSHSDIPGTNWCHDISAILAHTARQLIWATRAEYRKWQGMRRRKVLPPIDVESNELFQHRI